MRNSCSSYKNCFNVFFVCVFSVFAGCQIPYPKREFLSEDEPEEKTEKVTMADLKTFSQIFFLI